MANLKYFIWLATRKGFRAGELWELLSRFHSPEAVYFAERAEYELLGIAGARRESLEDKDLQGAEVILADCDRLGIHIMTIQDADYPELLGRIDDPPVVLYWRGKALNVDDRLSIGVVGTRKSTPYGESLAGRLGIELARRGVTLVSGMAEGIDAAGIKGALQGGGTVISVLGGGIDVVYPRQNRWLYEDVAAAGTLVSEYPPGTEHAGRHFPVRNRILSGLSRGVVVVEAGLPSGALISARVALDQNREVFAFPGPVGAEKSLGCNRLIQRGEAKLVLNADDLLEEFTGVLAREVPQGLPPMDERTVAERLDVEPVPAPSRPKEEKVVDKPPQRAYISLTDDPGVLTEEQRDILMAIQHKALTADDIAETAQLPAKRVLSALTMLQLQGWVEEKPSKKFYAAVIVAP